MAETAQSVNPDLMLDARIPLVAVVDDDLQPRGALRWGALVGDLRTKGRLSR